MNTNAKHADPPDWHFQVQQHLLWAVHTAAQHEPDAKDRNRLVTRLLHGVLNRW